jgi:hypothetical protein
MTHAPFAMRRIYGVTSGCSGASTKVGSRNILTALPKLSTVINVHRFGAVSSFSLALYLSEVNSSHFPSSFSKSRQVKLLITKNAFCIVQRATEQSKTGTFRGYGVEKLLRFSSRLV